MLSSSPSRRRGTNGSRKHGEFGLGGEKLGREKSQWRAGHLNRTSVTDHVTRLGFGIGIKPARCQSGVTDKLRDFRRRFEKSVRPELGQKTVFANGLNHAANAPARFINRDRHALAFQIKRGGQSRDAGPDDGDGFHAMTARLERAGLSIKQYENAEANLQEKPGK